MSRERSPCRAASKAFAGLALQERIEAKKARARCAIQAIDLRSDDVMHRVRFEGLVRELYDVAGLKDCARPMVIGFQTDEISGVVTVGAGCGCWGRRGAAADRSPPPAAHTWRIRPPSTRRLWPVM